MAVHTKTKRSYNSARRQAQARETRQQILEAARRLFTERGYSGATIDAIAQEAGVSVETVYATFGNKLNILTKLADVSVVGDDAPIPLLERPGPQAVRRERDQHKQIRMFASGIREIMSRMAPIFDVLRSAARAEPDIAALHEQRLQNRLHGMSFFVEALTSNGPLREGLSKADAVETVWAVSCAEVFSLLTVTRGWPLEKYEHWLADTLTRLLLP